MATRGPTGAPGQPARVLLAADEDPSADGLLLKVTLETEGGIALDQHAGIDRTVNRVAGGAALANGLMLENKRPALRSMTTATSVLFRGELGPTSHDRPSFMGIVAIAATDLALQDGMMVGQIKLSALVEVTTKASFGRFAGIDDGMERAPGLIVNAARSMT